MPDNELHEFVEQTLVEGFLQLARVNILTGEYVYLKKNDNRFVCGRKRTSRDK